MRKAILVVNVIDLDKGQTYTNSRHFNVKNDCIEGSELEKALLKAQERILSQAKVLSNG